MTNAQKYEEVFGLPVDKTMCPTEDCERCPVTVNGCNNESCESWWDSEYKESEA